MKLIHKIHSLFSNLTLTARSWLSKSPEHVRLQVPYVSQFANPAWAEMVLKSNQPLSKDLLWEDSGARSIKEYERWAMTTCGMACAAMLLSFYKMGEFKTIPLARDAAIAEVYTKEQDGSISSMQYRPFTKWVSKFNITATIYTHLTFRSISHLLSKNSLIIASVNPNIRDYDTAPKTQVGGHLILITGYNKKDQTITFHNPSGFENNQTQQNHTLPYKDFVIYFAGRGIAVRSSA